MKWATCTRILMMILVVIATLSLVPRVPGQAAGKGKINPLLPANLPQAKADDPVQAIDDEYNRQVLELAGAGWNSWPGSPPLGNPPRLRRPLRAALPPGDRRRSCLDRRGAAAKVLEQGTPSVATNAPGSFRQDHRRGRPWGLRPVAPKLAAGLDGSSPSGPRPPAGHPSRPAEVIGICEAYYQRLVEAKQFPIAREAFRLVLEKSISCRRSKNSSKAG